MKDLGNKIFGGLSNNSFGINIEQFYCRNVWEVVIQDGAGSPILQATSCNDEALDCSITFPSTTIPPSITTTTLPPSDSASFDITPPHFYLIPPSGYRFETFLRLFSPSKYISYANDNDVSFLMFQVQLLNPKNQPINFILVNIDPNKSEQVAYFSPTDPFNFSTDLIDGETYTIIVEDVFGDRYSVQYTHRIL
jgi:hypothetical protein